MKKIITVGNFLSLKNTILKNKKIVLVCGSFDMLHCGHLKFLEFAKTKGHILLLLLNSDKSIKKYKGNGRPIISQRDRAYLLQGLEVVDYIVIFNEITPEKYFRIINPQVFCNGLDWGKNFIGIENLKAIGTEIHYFNKKQTSASIIIERILKSVETKGVTALFFNKEIFSNLDLNYTLLKFNKLLKFSTNFKTQDFLNECNIHNIILNKSFYVGSNQMEIDFCKKVNLRVIKLSKTSNKKDEDYNIKSESELKSLINSMNSV